MSQVRSIRISALNIAMHKPHSPQRYIDLFRDARKVRQFIQLGALHGAVLGSLTGPKDFAPGVTLRGEIYRFVKLDASAPWFNIETADVATEGDTAKIQIPENLLPHLQRIEYVFRPDIHELWFVSKDRKDTMGPKAAATFFQYLFDRVATLHSYPKIEVTPLPDLESLDSMLSIERLERVTIELKRPNADDGDSDEIRWLGVLEKQKLKRMTTELVAVDGEGISLNADMTSLAHVAAHNGSVSVIGRDAAGVRIDESTVARPLAVIEQVDSELETSMDVLQRQADSR